MNMQERPLESIYMHTSAGTKYYPFAPDPEDVHIDTIARHLATRGRWAGATRHAADLWRIYYSVAEHSVYVSEDVEHRQMEPRHALAALLHDAPEAFNGDLIRPLKYSRLFREPFKEVEDRNEKAIFAHFDLDVRMNPCVKIADEAVCHTEWLQIVPRDPNEQWTSDWHDDSVTAPITIQMLPPHGAYALFIKRFRHILRNPDHYAVSKKVLNRYKDYA